MLYQLRTGTIYTLIKKYQCNTTYVTTIFTSPNDKILAGISNVDLVSRYAGFRIGLKLLISGFEPYLQRSVFVESELAML
jgi:hypothetical protein